MNASELKFLIDVGVGKGIEKYLREKGYDTETVRDIDSRMEDEKIIHAAVAENRMVVTMDKDFGELSPFEGVAIQIKQALLNILLNSIQAAEIPTSGHTGSITIVTRQESQEISCIIRDKGPGIPESVQQHVFNPFFTSHEPGKGKGLGLSTAYDIIVLKHNGKLSLSCPETGGTLVSITLPVTQLKKDK